jgi:hypothetical protein
LASEEGKRGFIGFGDEENRVRVLGNKKFDNSATDAFSLMFGVYKYRVIMVGY